MHYKSSVGLSGTTFAAFCATKSQEYMETFGSSSGFMDRSTFTKVFLAFYKMLEHSNNAPCSLCGQYPAILLADATDVGFPMRFTTSSLHLILSNTADPNTNTVVPFNKRIFLNQKKTRDLLTKFIFGLPTNLNKLEWTKLLKYLSKEAPSLGLYFFILFFLNTINFCFFQLKCSCIYFTSNWISTIYLLSTLLVCGKRCLMFWALMYQPLISFTHTHNLQHCGCAPILTWRFHMTICNFYKLMLQ